MFEKNLSFKSVAEQVQQLAKENGVVYKRTANDALAEVITRLSDDNVVTDATEDLIVALKRANVISGEVMVSLLGQHLREIRHV
jgi:hypothetical protein